MLYTLLCYIYKKKVFFVCTIIISVKYTSYIFIFFKFMAFKIFKLFSLRKINLVTL